MGLYNGAVITSAGQNLLAQAISGTELSWTVMRASSVAIPEGTDLTTLTALTGIEQTTGITDSSVYGSNVVQVSARFSNTGISEAYLMETIGIYGQVAGGSETLIAVMTAETPDEMPVYDQDSPSAFIFNVQMSVQNANSLTMVVNDTGTATVADLRRKVNLNGGDLSDTVVDTFTEATAEYPVPAAGDTMKVIGGKIVKFCADIVKTFTGASASTAGKKGLVPAPAAGRNTYYLRGDGTWQAPVNDNTTTVAGRVMDARQANPNISGTIAANVKSLNDSYTELSNRRINNLVYGYTETAKALATAFAIVPLDNTPFIGDAFVPVYDGGYRCTKSGIVLVSASGAVDGVNDGDVVVASVGGYYSNAWVYESQGFLASGITNRSFIVAQSLHRVQQGEIIYLRVRNSTAARGSVLQARMTVEYLV